LLNLISKVPDQVIAYICAYKSVPKKDYISVGSIQNQRKKLPEDLGSGRLQTEGRCEGWIESDSGLP
ncbi:MAG: hypothetical protein RR505_06400, partial [Raoultibacter sp.]